VSNKVDLVRDSVPPFKNSGTKTKGGGRFSKRKGGNQLFKLNLGIEKNKNGNF